MLLRKKLFRSGLCLALLLAFPVQAGKVKWKQYEGKGYLVCDAVLNELNRYDFTHVVFSPTTCAKQIIRHQFKALRQPEWERIEAREYKPLLRYMLSQNTSPLPKGQARNLDDEVEKFIDEGGYIQSWTTPLPEWLMSDIKRFGLRHYEVNKGPLIFARAVSPKISLNHKKSNDFLIKNCKGLPIVPDDKWVGKIHLANKQLNGPDERLAVYFPGANEQVSFSRYLNSMIEMKDVYIYKKKIYFLDKMGISIYNMDNLTSFGKSFCSIYQEVKF